MSDDRKPQWRPYLAYLEDRAARREEQAADLESEELYWRNRERLHAERQQDKKAA